MILRSNSGPGLAVAAALAGGIVAVLTATALAAVARPADQAARLAAVTQDLDTLRRLDRAPAGGLVYPKGAICRGAAGQGEALVEQAVRASLGQARLVGITFTPATAEAGALTPDVVRFETDGSYEDAVALIAALQSVRPMLFADTVDLVTDSSTVSLTFSGRFYCSSPEAL